MSFSVEQRLAAALAECERLRTENQQLRERQGLPQVEAAAQPTDDTAEFNSTPVTVTSKSSSDEKVKLFRSLFRGREDVYAARWEGRNGKTGYSPAHQKTWSNSFQKRPDEPKEYFPLTDQVIHDHLTGKLTAGVYPLLTDETCWFLAADFDKTTWQDDVRAFLQTCADWNIPAALERSRSGRGGHVWIFFDAALPAGLARKLGAAILTRTMERRHQLGLDSYDRFFPSQDTMPKGGFGNLIALPLQHLPRSHGNSVFLAADFNPHPDQWAFLSGIRRMSFSEIETLVRDAERSGEIIGIRCSVALTMMRTFTGARWDVSRQLPGHVSDVARKLRVCCADIARTRTGCGHGCGLTADWLWTGRGCGQRAGHSPASARTLPVCCPDANRILPD